LHHYPHHIGDYSKDTPGLTMMEHGAYRLLMDAYYASERAIPEDEPYAIAKASNALERKAVDKVLRKYFTLEDGHYHQKRIDLELAHYQEKADLNRKNGRLGGRPRNNPDGFPEITETVSKTEPRQEPKPNPEITLTKNQEPRTNKKQKRPLPEGFGVSPEVRAWAQVHGFARLDEHLAWFLDYARANGKTYADWDAALRNCIKGNWAKLPGQSAAPNPWEGAH
jgi:uncharacterized protein YdaU (DUF1376 family)